MTFQPGYQRCFARSNHPANMGANGIPTTANHPTNGCSPTPYNPLALETPNAGLGPLVVPIAFVDRNRVWGRKV